MAHCLDRGIEPTDLKLDELKKFSTKFGADVLRCLDPQRAVNRRKALGGTSGANVSRRLKKLGG